MTHVAVDLVEVMMRQNNLEAKKLIPALLNYNKTADVPLNQVCVQLYLDIDYLLIQRLEPSSALPAVLYKSTSLY